MSEGCRFCYAETLMDHRYGRVKWGPRGTRVRTSAANWKKPFKWDREASALGERRKVFCASLADVFEDRTELDPWRRDLARLIWETPNLDWLLLTKRPENASQMLYEMWFPDAAWPKNYWLGVSVEDQARKDRIDILRTVPAAVRFLSLEPLLEDLGEIDLGGIHWVIVGGESGPKARPCDLDWIESILDQCQAAGIPAFCKQLGANLRGYDEQCWRCGHHDWGCFDQVPGTGPRYKNCNVCGANSTRCRDPKGGDPSEWPEELFVRQFPGVPHA